MNFATIDSANDWIHSMGVWREWEETYPNEFHAWLDAWPELRRSMY